MAVELLQDSIHYQAKTKLLALAVELASTRNPNKLESQIIQGAKIHRLCQALDYDDFLTKAQRDRIVRTLVEVAEINDFGVAPSLGNISAPSIVVGVRGSTGATGATGPEGGGVPFSATNVTTDTICDTFAITESRGVCYEMNIYDDSGSDMRTMRLQGGWSSDGSVYGDDGGIGQTIQGNCDGISMSIIVVGTAVRLMATVTSGTWTVEGTRKYVPNNGNGIVNPTTLANGKIWVGNASNSPTAVTVSGDFTISNTGIGAIASGSIVNNDVSSTAAISHSKMSALTASRAMVTDANGVATVSSTTATQIGYLSTVTSDVQVQLDSKISSASGAISTVTSTDLTASRALISNPSGKIAVSAVTSTELAVLDGITATTTELNYCDGVTSSIQDQLDDRVDGTGLNIAVLEIGDWDMDTDQVAIVSLAGTTTWDKVRSVSVMIRRDADAAQPDVLADLTQGAQNTDWERQGIAWASGDGVLTSNGIVLQRKTGGYFDSSIYDNTSFNRGFITVVFAD